MSQTNFLIRLQDKLTVPGLSLVVSSLRQDPLVWQWIIRPDSYEKVFNEIGDEIYQWNPGFLSLISLGKPELWNILRNADCTSLPSDLVGFSNATYDRVISTRSAPEDLVSAAWLALAQVFRAKSGFILQNDLSDLSRLYGARFFQTWRTPLSVISAFYDTTPSLLSISDRGTGLLMITHTILSYVDQPEKVFNKAMSLLLQLPKNEQLFVIDFIKGCGRISLAKELAKGLIDQSGVLTDQCDEKGQLIKKYQKFEIIQHYEWQGLLYRIVGDAYKSREAFERASSENRHWLKSIENLYPESKKDESILKNMSKFDENDNQSNLFFAQVGENYSPFPGIEISSQQVSDELSAFLKSLVEANRLLSLNQNEEALQVVKNAVMQMADHFSNNPELFSETMIFEFSPAEFIAGLRKYGIVREVLKLALVLLKYYPTNVALIDIVQGIATETGEKQIALENTLLALSLEPSRVDLMRQAALIFEEQKNWEQAYQRWKQYCETQEQPEYEDLTHYARCAYQSNHIDEAELLASNLLAQEPEDVEVTTILGKVLYSQNQNEEAVACFSRATFLDPEYGEAWLMLIRIFREMGDHERSQKTLHAALEIASNSPEIQMEMAHQFFAEEKFHESLPYLRTAFDLCPESVEIGERLGRTLHLLGYLLESSLVYQKCFSLNPANYHLALAYSTLLYELGEKDRAVEVLDFVMQEEHVPIEVLLQYVEILLDGVNKHFIYVECLSNERLVKAKNILERVLNEDSSNFKANLLYTEVFLLRENSVQAVESYRRLLTQIDYTSCEWQARINLGLGLAVFNQGMYESAVAALKEALITYPDDIHLKKWLVDAYLHIGIKEEAYSLGKHILETNMQDVGILIWFSDIASEVNKIEEAIQILEKVQELSPGHIEGGLQLIRAYIKNHHQEMAQKVLVSLLKTGPLSEVDLRRISYGFIELGDISSAKKVLDEMLHSSSLKSWSFYFEYVWICLSLGEKLQALALSDSMVHDFPDSLFAILIHADLLIINGDIKSAIHTLENNIDKVFEVEKLDIPSTIQDCLGMRSWIAFSKNPEGMIYRLLFLLRNEGNYEKAYQLVKERTAISENSKLFNLLAADLAYSCLDYESCRMILKAFIDGESNVNVEKQNNKKSIISFSRCYEGEQLLEAKKYAEWNTLFEAVDIQPSIWELSQIVRYKSLKGDYKEAEILFRQLLKEVEESTQTIESVVNLDELINYYNNHSVIQHETWLLETMRLMNDWNNIANYSKSLIGKKLSPLLSLKIVHVMVEMVEWSRFCSEIHCIAHTPSIIDFAAEYEVFLDILTHLKSLIDDAEVERWKVRGEAAFNLNEKSVKNLGFHLRFPDDVNILLASLRQVGSCELAARLIERIPYDSIDPIQAALVYLKQSHEKSVDWAKLSVKNHPSNPIALFVLGYIYLQIEEWRDSLSYFESALKIWSDEPVWHAFAAESASRLGEEQIALCHLEIAQRLQPDSGEYAFRLGQKYLLVKEYLKAIDILDLATKLDQNNVEILLALVRANLKVGDTEKAYQNIEKALHISPDCLDALLLHAEIDLLRGNIDTAKSYAQKVINIYPENPDAIMIFCKVLWLSGQKSEATQMLKDSVVKFRESSDLMYTYLSLKSSDIGYQEVISEIVDASQRFASETRFWELLARAQFDIGNQREAEEAARAALTLDQELPDMNILLAEIKYRDGDLDQAIQLLSDVVQVDPDNIEAYLKLGKIRYERREISQALNIFEKVISLFPMDYRAYYHAGILFREQKEYLHAERMLRKAAELSPQDVNIRRQLGAVIALNLVHNSIETGYRV